MNADNGETRRSSAPPTLETELARERVTAEDLVTMLELAAEAVERYDELGSGQRAIIRRYAPKFAAAMDRLSTENRSD